MLDAERLGRADLPGLGQQPQLVGRSEYRVGTVAVVVCSSEHGLRQCVAVFDGPAIPAHSCGGVRWNTQAEVVHVPESELCVSVTLLGAADQFFECPCRRDLCLQTLLCGQNEKNETQGKGVLYWG